MLENIDVAQIELNKFIDVVLRYAKKHKLSYVIAIGKRIELAQQTVVMDSWWATHDGDLDAMTQALVKPGGAIPAGIARGIMAEAKELAKKSSH